MKLSLQEVEHVAQLARIGLTDEEKEMFRDQLSAILEYMEKLNELNTSQISPTAQVITLGNVMRSDEVGPCLSQEEVLANAPKKEQGCFRVQPVLE